MEAKSNATYSYERREFQHARNILRRNRSDELSRIRAENINQIGRRSLENTIPTTPRLHKSNGRTLRNFNRKRPTDMHKRPANNSQR